MKTSGYSYAQDNLVQDNSTDGREELSVPCLPAMCPGLGRPVVSAGCTECIRVWGDIINLILETH